jgi:hypothetical protein
MSYYVPVNNAMKFSHTLLFLLSLFVLSDCDIMNKNHIIQIIFVAAIAVTMAIPEECSTVAQQQPIPHQGTTGRILNPKKGKSKCWKC